MYQPTQNFINELNKDSRQFRARMTVGNEQITDIKTFVQNTGSCGADTFTIGSVFASYADITMRNTDISLTGQEFLLEIGLVLSDASVEYLPMGYFTVESPSDISKERDQITAKAVDRIATKCSGTYAPSIVFPCTIGDVLSDIGYQAGVTIVCELDTSGVIETAMNNLSYRDALGYLAGLLGGFCYSDKEGNIKIAPYPTVASLEISKDRFAELKPAETVYSIESFTVVISGDGNEATEVIYSDGDGYGLKVTNPYMTEAQFYAVKDSIIGYSFYSGSAKFLGDPRIGPEDAINAVNYADETFFFPCMSIIQDFDGGLTTTISTPGKNESDSSAKGPLQKAVDALSTDLKLKAKSILLQVEGIEIGARNLIRNSETMIYPDYGFTDPNLVVTDDGNGNVTAESAAILVSDNGTGGTILDSEVYGVSDDGAGAVTIEEIYEGQSVTGIQMKTLTIGGRTFEIVDEFAREEIARLSNLPNKYTELPADGIPLVDAMYFLGAVTSMSFGLPESAENGDMIYISFDTGNTAPSFIVQTDNHTGLNGLTIKQNSYYELIGLWNGSKWVFVTNEVANE